MTESGSGDSFFIFIYQLLFYFELIWGEVGKQEKLSFAIEIL